MAESVELSPSELDHLEDSLEDLELAPSRAELSAAVRGRLQDYRQILTLSRAALPMVEVPRGLLDAVLAEARAAAEVPSVVPVEAAPPKRDSLWTRLRRAALLPGVALATTAALVLIMVERKDESAPSSAASPVALRPVPAGNTAVSQSAPLRREESRAGEDAAKTFEYAAEPAAPAASLAAPGATPPPPPVTAAPAEAEAQDKAVADQLIGGELAEKKKAKPADEAPNAAPTVVDRETTPRWDIIARGDRARHKSDCATARSEYKLALDDMDARVRSRAHAGLGLCSAQDGDRSAADAAYEQARALDAEIAGFIEAERPRGAGSKPPNAARSSPKKAKSAAPLLDDAFEREPGE